MKKQADSPGKLTDLPNIGKTTAAKLEKIGIKTKEDFLKRAYVIKMGFRI